MRTITIIFTNGKEVASYKEYKFLCNYDTVSLYDIVEDPRYNSKMMLFQCWGSYHNGKYYYLS